VSETFALGITFTADATVTHADGTTDADDNNTLED
jgi:hypothetical protein